MAVLGSTSGHLLMEHGRIPNHILMPCVPCATIVFIFHHFVGGDYFCESGYNVTWMCFHSDDVLWDVEEDCNSRLLVLYTCCAPPYFTNCKTLNETTTDDLELRLFESDDNIAVELLVEL